VLNETALVLEGVTLGEMVELVVKVLVDLTAGAVLHEETTEDPLAAHPKNLPIIDVSAAIPRLPIHQIYPRIGVGRTRAYGHRRYPCAYRRHGGDRRGGRG